MGTHINNSITEVPLLTEEDVGCPSNKTPNSYIRQEVMLLQGHIGQAQITLRTTKP